MKNGSGTITNSGVDPREEYRRRMTGLDRRLTALRSKDKLLVAAKIVAAAVLLACVVWFAKFDRQHVRAVLYPLAVFVALFVIHERILRKLRRCTRSRTFYQQGMDRLEDRWHGQGNQGESFLDPGHPYARDLNLFGRASLFELIATARTRAGEKTLAEWLLTPAPRDEALQRQSAVRELTPKFDLRERLALAGEDAHRGSRPESLVTWSAIAERAVPPWAPLLLLPMALLWPFSLIAWFVWGWSKFALAMSLLNYGVSYFIRSRVMKAVESSEQATHEVSLIGAVFSVIETDRFISERFAVRPPASGALQKLGRYADWLASHHNLFVRAFDGFIFFTPLCVAAIESWRCRYGHLVGGWMTKLGEMEAVSSLAGYAYEHPENTYPEFVDHGPLFDAEALAHPLLPFSHAIGNDLKLGDSLQLLVISGPNMAGKSTFVRAIGLNAVLAHAGAPVPARRLRLSRLQVAASICVSDSLESGLSRFYAEIKRLKQIADLSEGPLPVLFLLDELLSGTNSHDRRLGTEAVLRTLLSHGSAGVVTTHDLALTRIAEGWKGAAANAHFEDTFADGELHFEYRLSPGIAHTTNALELMRSIGLDVSPANK